MKNQKVLAFALLVLSLTQAPCLSPLLADTSTPTTASSAIKGEATDGEHKDWISAVLAALGSIFWL